MNFLNYYLGKEADDKGRKITDILKWSDIRLEYTHNYIQRVFPSLDASGADPSAPIISIKEADQIRKVFCGDINSIVYFKQMYEKILAFWKLDKPFMKKPHWIKHRNHNFLRITRVLNCLDVFGLDQEAQALRVKLQKLCNEYPCIIRETQDYWKL